MSGTVRDAAGNPQPGIRVAAQAIPTDNAKSADVLVSIGKTDESGRYSLEIPPGRYYIIAGRVNSPTYYPKATSTDRATVFSITPGAKTEGIDFTVFALTGVVRDSAGKPQFGVSVAAININQPLGCQNDLAIETETDIDGRYRLEVMPGEYSIVARLPGRTRFYPKAESRESATSVPVKDGITSSGLDIEVPAGTVPPPGDKPVRDLYFIALENSRWGCHVVARLQFHVLIETFPTSEYAAEARFEMGESHFLEGVPTPSAMAEAMRWFSDYLRLSPAASRLPQARQRLLEIQKKLPR